MINFKDIKNKFSQSIDSLRKNKIVGRIIDEEKKIGSKISKKIEDQKNKVHIETSVAVDIGSSSIKVVQFSKIKGLSVLDTFGEIALGPFINKEIGEPVSLDPKTLAHALDIILDAAGADSTKVSYCVSPNQSFIYSFNYNKKLNKNKKVSDFVLGQIKDKYNIDIDLYEIEYNKIENQYFEDDEDVKYEVRGVKKRVLKKDKVLSKTLELKTHLIKTEAKSILYAVNHFYPSDYLIIDIGAATTKIYIINEDNIYNYKIINTGSHGIIKDFNLKSSENKDDNKFIGSTINSLFAKHLQERLGNKEKSDVMEDMISQIHDFLKSFEVEHKKFIDNVVLTGGGALFAGLEEYISKKLDRDVHIADPFSKVKNPNFANEKLKEVGPEYAAAIGLALESLNE